jgi:hypothetical protein
VFVPKLLSANKQMLNCDIMRKAAASLVVTVSSSALTLTASAQTDASNSASTLVGEAIAVVVFVAIIGVIAYAGYKVVRKWSGGSSRPESD